jgi:transposase
LRLSQEHRGEYPSLWAAVESIAPKVGCVPQPLLDWVKRDEVDDGQRDDMTNSERDNKGMRRANDILKTASVFFAQGKIDRRLKS